MVTNYHSEIFTKCNKKYQNSKKSQMYKVSFIKKILTGQRKSNVSISQENDMWTNRMYMNLALLQKVTGK